MKKLFLMTVMAMATTLSFAQKDWAQFGRYEKANAELKKAPEVVFMGNSITDNWFRFDADFFTRNNFAGRGISGQTTSEMLVRFRKDIVELKPKAVVILAGINDIAQNNGYIKLENVLSNLISMSELAQKNKIKVIFCSVLPCNKLGWRPEIKPAEEVKKLNAMIREYASKNKITYCDYYSPLVDAEDGLPLALSDDGCHPKFNCYTIMEAIVVKAIGQTLKSKKVYYVSKPKAE